MFEKMLYVFTVDGMKCEKCSERIKTNIKKIKGTKSVEVDLDNKLVIVTAKRKVEPETISECIKSLGFSFTLLINVANLTN